MATLEDDLRDNIVTREPSSGFLTTAKYKCDNCPRQYQAFALNRVDTNVYRCKQCDREEVRAQPPAEVDPIEKALVQARSYRNRVLLATDWTQVPDNRLTTEQKEAWAAYREAVRTQVDAVKLGLEAEWPDPPAETPDMGEEGGEM
jgi:DNA-directed RNA polymerase subunit RPC12/RpoP